MFTEIQIEIIKLLKTARSFSLAQISRKINANKSTVIYHLKKLEDDGVVESIKKSSKKIEYTLASKNNLENFIDKKSGELENLLIRTSVEGLDAYIDLLNLFVNGESDTIGYGNIEFKVIPELEKYLVSFRDKFAATGRTDRFVVPDSLTNIDLLKDHYRKPEWKKCFKGRVIERSKMYVNADIYVWDGTVGICSFENNKFEVTIHRDRITYETYKSLLEILWENAKEVEDLGF